MSPCSPCDTFLGRGSGTDSTSKTVLAPCGRAFHGIQGGITRDYTPIAETMEKTPAEDTGETPPAKVEDAPAGEEEPACVTPAEDDVVEIHAGAEDLD